MSTPGPTVPSYAFLPWLKQGLARAIPVADDPCAAIAGRVTLPVALAVEGAGDVQMNVRLYGPGDVTGLDPRQVIRTDPRPGAVGGEDSYLAAVDFRRADLPWLFTPATASSAGRLRPWLCLVVVSPGPGIVVDPNAGGPLPVLEIGPPANPAAELPDLSQSWAWAHAQIAGSTDGQEIGEILRDSPARASSRLLCPRRLQPQTSYLACVVPTFELGVIAGLGLAPQPSDEAALAPAWTLDGSVGELRLPVYYSWQFSTGPAGDFESLVRLIKPRPLPPEASQPPRLDLSDGGHGLPQLDPTTPGVVVGLESAIRLPGPDAPPPWADAGRVPFQQALERVLGTAPAATLTPPVYGALQAGAAGLPADGQEPAWLRELNLDPRLRVAAAAGTRVVQDNQEVLLASAWEQAGAVRQSNTLLRQAQLARELGVVLYERHLQPLAPAELLAVTAPAHAQIEISTQTLADALQASRLPEAAVSGAFRRLASPQGALLRRAVPADAQRGPLDVLPAFDRLATAPAPPPPAGMVALAAAAPPAPAAADRPAFAPESVQALLLDRLQPGLTVVAHAQTLVAAPAETWQRTDPLAPLAPALEFPQPMYGGLRDAAPELLLPGVEHVPADTVALLETSPRLIEAYMVGLNHELSRELLWREYPTDLRGTWFRQFWDVSGQTGDPESLKDIPPLGQWAGTPLGQHLRGPGGGGQIVLLVRGELLHRYPTTNVYASPAGGDGQPDTATRLAPMFRGALDPDISFLGFALTPAAAVGTDPAGPGWFFVFEQHPGEPRFGFDEQSTTSTPTTPDDLAWPLVPLGASGYVDLGKPLKRASADLQAAWGRDAASTVQLTLQRPVRVAVHASTILAVEESG
jgi:hypothetical protein